MQPYEWADGVIAYAEDIQVEKKLKRQGDEPVFSLEQKGA